MHFGLLGIFQNYRGESNDADVVKGEFALAKLADQLGFDSYWAVEHHFFDYSMCPDNVQWLAQVAAATERIQLGTGAVIMPWMIYFQQSAIVAKKLNPAHEERERADTLVGSLLTQAIMIGALVTLAANRSLATHGGKHLSSVQDMVDNVAPIFGLVSAIGVHPVAM